MIVIQLALLGSITAIFTTWRFDSLRPLAIMLAITAVLGLALDPMGMTEKSIYRVIIDVACGMGAAVVYFKHRNWTAGVFIFLSLLCLCAHSLYFLPPLIGLVRVDPFYVNASLDVLFFVMLFLVAGAGYVRCYRHIALPHWIVSTRRRATQSVR